MSRRVMYRIATSVKIPTFTINEYEITKRGNKRVYIESKTKRYVKIEDIGEVIEGLFADSRVIYFEGRDNKHQYKEKLREYMLEMVTDRIEILGKAKKKFII